MKVTPTHLPEVLVIEPLVHVDERGSFAELWRKEGYSAAGLPASFVQDNVSFSRRGVLRGLHLQHPRGQGKLVCSLRGRIVDVAVDVRVGSPRFGQWVAVSLDAVSLRQIYIPAGFAHGFCATDEAVVVYKCTEIYEPEQEIKIAWDDPAIGVDWPLPNPVVGARDRGSPHLAEVIDKLPRWRPQAATAPATAQETR